MKRAAVVIAATAALLCSCGGTASDGAPILRPSKATVLGTNTSDRPVLSSVVTSRGPEVGQVTVRPEAEQPNVVVVMTDDQTVESMRVLPKTRALIGDQGVSFDNSIVTYPTCCPSRATFFTGQYAHNNGVRFNNGKTGGYPNFAHQETAMPAALQKAGYRTAHIGKFLNQYGEDYESTTTPPPGWTRWAALVGASTGQYFGFTLNEDGKLVTYPEDRYQTDVLTDLAVDEIVTASEGDKPFFLSVAYLAPHMGFGCPLAECTPELIKNEVENANSGVKLNFPLPAPKYADVFAAEPLPKKVTYDQITFGQSASLITPFDESQHKQILQNYRGALGTLLSVDDGVERIMGQLEASGVLDNTIVIFTSDNGFFYGEHRFMYGKYQPYEESLAVPLMIRGPGVAVGETNNAVVTNADLAPTILEATGAKALRTMDGVSLRPLLSDPALLWERPVGIEGLSPPITLQPEWHGVRTRRFAYFEFVSGGINGVELYDILVDPLQINNLAIDPSFAAVVAEFHRQSLTLRSCVGAECWSITSPDGFEAPA